VTRPDNRFEKENALVAKAKGGDHRAFGRLVEMYQDQIFALSYDLMGNYDDASDLAQEAFIRGFRSLGSFEERARFSTWLYRITVNLAMDVHRKRRRRPTSSFEAHFRDGAPPEKSSALVEMPTDSFETEEVHRILQGALDQLTENQRTATVLKYFHQRSCKEIAEMMGCAEGTVRIHLHRALNHLRNRIKKREIYHE
jgi:RNA polymerase sigma-70 factor (ECF subfamily)